MIPLPPVKGMLRRQNALRALAAVLAVLLLAGVYPTPSAASRLDDFRRTLQRIDRQLCNKFNKQSCRRKATKPPNPAKKQAATASGANDRKAPKPVLKIAKTPPRSPPTPVLKQENLQAGKKPPAVDETPAKADLPSTVPQAPVRPAALRKLAFPKLKLPRVVNVMPDDALSGENCIVALLKMKVNFDVVATPVVSGSCSVAEPVRLKSIGAGEARVTFPDEPLLTCGFAARFSSWTLEKAAPAVRNATGNRLRSVGTGPGYQCRGRNGDFSAKLSEHAFGNAVDIEYFRLASGGSVKVSEARNLLSQNRGMLAYLRSTGCEYFTTVLGPGSNSAHESHFHFDLERRGKKGNHKLCQ